MPDLIDRSFSVNLQEIRSFRLYTCFLLVIPVLVLEYLDIFLQIVATSLRTDLQSLVQKFTLSSNKGRFKFFKLLTNYLLLLWQIVDEFNFQPGAKASQRNRLRKWVDFYNSTLKFIREHELCFTQVRDKLAEATMAKKILVTVMYSAVMRNTDFLCRWHTLDEDSRKALSVLMNCSISSVARILNTFLITLIMKMLKLSDSFQRH